MSNDDKGYYEIQLDNKWLILIFLGIVCLLGLVFVWGMKVGKDAAELERGVQSMQGSPVNENKLPEEDLSQNGGSDLESFDLKTNLIKEKPLTDSSRTQSTRAGKATDRAEEKKPVKSTTSGKKSIPDPSSRSSLEQENKPSVPKGQYVIQIVSVRSKEKAEYYVQVLKNQQYPAFLSSVELGNTGLFYRVRVGGYKTQQEAQRMVQRILSDSKLQPILNGKKNLLITKQY